MSRSGAAIPVIGPRIRRGWRRASRGSSSADRSPGSRPSQAARMTRRMTLPERVLGRDRTTATTSGLSGLPRSAAMRRATSARRPSSSRSPGRRTHSTTIASPLISCGTPIAAASSTAGCADGGALDLGRADPLARHLERVVRAAVDEPEAVGVDLGPVAVHPQAGPARPVRLHVALRGRPRSRGSCPASARG